MDEPEFVWRLTQGIIDHREEIDQIISRAAPEWPLNQISVIDRNSLRIGLYELLYADRKEVPARVAINEAIEIAKISAVLMRENLSTVFWERFIKK